MKTSTKITLGVAALAAVGLTIYLMNKEKNNRDLRMAHVADEGYETAHDVLYPEKRVSPRLKYGPVLPE